MKDKRLADLFAADPGRAKRLSLRFGDIHLDYSNTLVTDETMRLLHDLARGADLGAWISGLFGGQAVNTSENRPALHTALRRRSGPLVVDGVDVMADILAVRERMRRFTHAVRSGAWRGPGGQRITDVVNICSGASHLHPPLVPPPLTPPAPPPLPPPLLSPLHSPPS